ncbi:MAG: low molecular weight protein-tyrosine-phosphatase [Bacteroidia bacterium]
MKILMVCLGNICRSPMAEVILKEKITAENLDWHIESCGTESFHVGENADRRAIAVCGENGIDLSEHIAKRFTPAFFAEYDMIYALATDVYREISHFAKNKEVEMQNVKLLLSEVYPNEKLSVKDPWYGTKQDFVEVFEQLNWVCEEIVEKYKAGD